VTCLKCNCVRLGKCFQLRPISIVDNFFDIWGHSLLACGLSSQIAELFGQNLDRTLCRTGQYAGFSYFLTSKGISKGANPVSRHSPQGSRTPFFLCSSCWWHVFLLVLICTFFRTRSTLFGLHAPLGASTGGKEKTVGTQRGDSCSLYCIYYQHVQPQDHIF